MREQNKSCIGEEIFSRGSKCNNKEYIVLEGSAGRKIISNKNEVKQFKNGKQLTLKTAPTRDGKLWKNITFTENSNGRRIERPLHTSLLNSSHKASRYATPRQINSADGSIGHIVAMVTYCATKLTATCSPMIGQFVDTMMLTSTSIE